MGTLKRFALLALAAFLLGCQAITHEQKEFAAAVGYRIIDLFQAASDGIVQIIVTRARSPQDASEAADWLDSAANGLRSLETKSGGFVTADVVEVTVRQFTDPQKVHWSELARELAESFHAATLPSNEALETIAIAANEQAAALRAAQ